MRGGDGGTQVCVPLCLPRLCSREPRPCQEGSGRSVEGGAWLLLAARGQSEAGRGPPRLQDAQVLLGFQPAGC